MRLIDADALKELFSEVIGHIAKKPEMNGNLEHMIRASAMIIQMIDDAPTAQPSAEPEAISKWKKEFREYVDSLDIARDDWKGIIEYIDDAPTVQPETNCSEIPNNSDTVSRQAAKDIFTELYGISAIGSVFDKYEWADICETTANELPSAQPERKTGRWIPCPQNASWLYVYKCSECGGYLQISDVDGKGYKANYCSYCGAKMEGGEEG